ncbi:MAG: cysteine--tRNA ligase [Acidimicrobiia bacterium]|nr:cysteine--tRNA ligase [Acidimicrobiia bacterium]
MAELLPENTQVTFYDTKLRKNVDFKPRDEGKVSIYQCGPTVYDDPHLGHGRTAFTYDLIRRFFRYIGYEVTLARNITDIEDKIIAKAQQENVEESVITKRYEQTYLEQLDSLGIERPEFDPHATEYVPQMVELIKKLIEKDFAYETSTSIYFSVTDYKEYGSLSHRTLDDLIESAGSRIDVDEEKKSPLDFALWKKVKQDGPSWPSPWGDGRPGWHTECVAMSIGILGQGFDIHGGGTDLVFPHHENEIAQSCGVGDVFAKYWIHSAMLNINGEKMSKSLNNFITLKDAISQHGPRALRLLMIQTHYRSQIEVSDESLGAASAAMDRLDSFYRRFNRELDVDSSAQIDELIQRRFINLLANDFNAPQALGLVFEALREANISLDEKEYDRVKVLFVTIVELMQVLGIDLTELVSTKANIDENQILDLIEQRKVARETKDFSRADEIRDELISHGVVIEDGPKGTTWHVETKIK